MNETRTWLLELAVTVEQPETPEPVEDLGDLDPRLYHDIHEAVTAAVARQFADWPEIKVEGQMMRTMVLDGLPGVGRCAECNRWVFDGESHAGVTPPLTPGAVVDGRLLCDDDLPEDHPMAF